MQPEHSGNSFSVPKSVLIAEDNPELRLLFARVFAREQFVVRVAVDGIDTVEKLREELSDLLVLDVNLPRMSGLDVLTYIRQDDTMKHLKIVVVTGNCMAMTYPEADLADVFLIKPVDILQLTGLVQRLV